jgi:putative inorganic carbon (hco3(-)) transporter
MGDILAPLSRPSSIFQNSQLGSPNRLRLLGYACSQTTVRDNRPMRDLMVLLLWAPMCLATIAEPYLGVLIWTWTALVKPNNYLYGLMENVPFDKVIAISTLIMLALKWNRRLENYKNFIVSKSTFFLGCLTLAGLISCCLGISTKVDPWYRYSTLWKVLILCLVIDNTIEGRVRIHSLILTLSIALGLGTALEGPRFVYSGGNHLAMGPWSAEDNNIFGVAILMSLPVTLYLRSYSRAKAARIGFLVVAGCSLIALVGTFSRGGLVGFVAMCLYYVARSGRRAFGALWVVCLAGLCIWLVAPDRWFVRTATIATMEQDDSFMGRVTAWRVSTLIALDRPLTGAGFDAVQDPRIWTIYARDLGDPTSMVSGWSAPHAAHSIYFQILGDLGFPGLGFFLLILLNGFASAWAVPRAVKRAPAGRPDLRWAVDLAFALELSLVGYAVAGGALSLAYLEPFYVLVTVLAVLRRSVMAELAGETVIASPWRLVGQRQAL